MKKQIKITTITNNKIDNYITNGIINDNILIYLEKDHTKTKYDYNNNCLIRENNNIRMNYNFINKKQTIGKIYINELRKNIDVILKTNNIVIDNYNLYINFYVEDETIEYKIEVL